MFINYQYTFNQYLYWPYQQAMEIDYFEAGIYEGDLLWTLLFGA